MDYDFTYTGAEIQAILDTAKKLKDSGYIFLGVATPSTNPGTPTQKVYYEAKQAGTYTNFGGVVLPDGISLLIWNGSWTSETVMCGDGGVFDISVYKSSGGTLATFADLAAALNGGNNIPVGARKGGMSVKFVQSSDNKYMQFRYMSTSTAAADFTNTANWQGVDDVPTAGSENLVVSRGVSYVNNRLEGKLSNNGYNIPIEIGGINGDGSKSSATARARCSVFIDNTKPVTIKINGSLYLYNYNTYNSESLDSFVEQVAVSGKDIKGFRFETGKYLILVLKRADGSNITNSDLQTTLNVITDDNVEEELFKSHDELGAKIGFINIGEVQIGNIDQTTGKVTYVDTNRAFSSFVDGTNTDVSVECMDNVIIYIVLKYTTYNGVPTGAVAINASSKTFDSTNYGCLLRFVFKKSDNSAFTLNDLSKIKISTNGYLKNQIDQLNEKVNNSIGGDIALYQGGVNADTGEVQTNISSSRVRTDLIAGYLRVVLNSGYKILYVLKYQTNGTYIGIVNHSDMYFEAYDGHLYRFVFSKTSTSQEISPTEPIIKTSLIALEYTSSNRTAYHAKNISDDIVTSKLIPYTRGTTNIDMSYDASSEYDRLNILFMTDNHVDLGEVQQSMQNFIDAISFANDERNDIDVIIDGGDLVTNEYPNKQKFIGTLTKVFDESKKSVVPYLFTKGNHDLNNHEPIQYAMDDDDWSSVWYDYAENNYGIVRQLKSNNKKSTWYYKDLAAFKVRIISLDCYDLDTSYLDSNDVMKYWGGTSTYISNEQMNWLASTALNFDDKTEKDWGVIVFLHYLRSTDVNGTSVEPIFESINPKLLSMLNAFNTQGTYSETYTFERSFFDLDIDADWTRYANISDKPYLVGVLSGHMHWDSHEIAQNVVNIRTANAFCGESAADNRLRREFATTTQNIFDIVNIDLKKRKIRCIRYGAGVNNYGNGGDRFLPDGLSF